jgi:hypothetical protein
MTPLEQEIFNELKKFDSDFGKGTNLVKLHNIIVEQDAKAAAEVAKKHIDQSSMEFFVWLCRVAKVDVLNAETAIECHGFTDNHFVPVLTLKELYNKWSNEKTLI